MEVKTMEGNWPEAEPSCEGRWRLSRLPKTEDKKVNNNTKLIIIKKFISEKSYDKIELNNNNTKLYFRKSCDKMDLKHTYYETKAFLSGNINKQ